MDSLDILLAGAIGGAVGYCISSGRTYCKLNTSAVRGLYNALTQFVIFHSEHYVSLYRKIKDGKVEEAQEIMQQEILQVRDVLIALKDGVEISEDLNFKPRGQVKKRLEQQLSEIDKTILPNK